MQQQPPACFKKAYVARLILFPFLVFGCILLHATTTTRLLHDVVRPLEQEKEVLMGLPLPDAIPTTAQEENSVVVSSLTGTDVAVDTSTMEELRNMIKGDIEHAVASVAAQLVQLSQENMALQQKMDETQRALAAMKGSHGQGQGRAQGQDNRYHLREEKGTLIMRPQRPDAVPPPPQQDKSSLLSLRVRGGALSLSSSSSLTGNVFTAADKKKKMMKKKKKKKKKKKEKKKKNAYSFQIAPCDPDQPIAVYRHFLYAVYTNIYALKYKHGSQADFHVYIEMLHESPHKKLPDEEERVLRELGDTYVHYIPTQSGQSFYRTQLQKFRILGLEQYSHVWHLDADILPLTNLDYVFNLIDQGVLRKNVAFAEGHEPANGGSFIVSPRPGALKEINDIIYRRERTPWNDVVGWGHAITAPDRYVTTTPGKPTGTLWDFYGGGADQGLLFYWIKYVEKDVSFILANGAIEHWGPSQPGEDDNGRQPVKLLEVTGEDALKDLEETLPKSAPMLPHWQKISQWQRQNMDFEKPRPLRDFIHFFSWKKPWQFGLPKDYFSPETSPVKTHMHYWFSLFDEVNQKHHLGVNLTTFTSLVELYSEGPAAGRFTGKYLYPPGYHPVTYDSIRVTPGGPFTTLIDDT